MPVLRPNVASRTTRLSSRASPHNPSVALFEVNQNSETVGTPISSHSRPKPRINVRTSPSKADLVDLEDSVHELVSSSTPSTPLRGASKSPRKTKAVKQSLDIPHPEPARWCETYDTIRDMRSRIVAPVDTMGCEQAQLKEPDPKNQRFSTLISLMLSSQTKDEVTDAAVAKLREAVGGTLSIDAIINAEKSIISDAIGKVGFWRRKTEYIKETAQRLRDDFHSDVPNTVDDLCSLPGVGPKMAFLTLQVAWKLNAGIGVDVHVHRITNRLKWHKPATKNPEETRLNLQSWLPKDRHGEINHMLVGFGQTICLPVGPRCDLCDLSTKGLCPSAQKVVNSKNRKAIALSVASSGPKIEVSMDVEEEVKFGEVLPNIEPESSVITDI